METIRKLLRLLPPALPGKARLARALLNHQLATQDVATYDRFGNHFTLPNLIEPIGFYLFINGVYEPQTMGFILRHLEPGSTFVDVGANKGKVLAIEVLPRVFPYLEANIRGKQFGTYLDETSRSLQSNRWEDSFL